MRKKGYGCDLTETKLFAFHLFLFISNDFMQAAREIDCIK